VNKKLIFIFSILIVGMFLVSAQGCCVKLRLNGGWCQPANSGAECAVNTLFDSSSPTCDAYPEQCGLITCYDSSRGECSSSTPKRVCEENGGEVVADGDSRCILGCCESLGKNMRMMTQNQCITASNSLGENVLFNAEKDETTCIYGSLEQGACIQGGGVYGENCVRKTEAECLDGTFYRGDLCSKHESESGCKAQEKIGCATEEGKYNIYWFDSCEQRENIYLGNSPQKKAESNNSGRIMTSPEESGSGCNYGGDCGVCNYPESSICSPFSGDENNKVNAGDFYCKKIDCENAPLNNGEKTTKKNQDEWCLFDGFIGKGMDTVGSEHYLVRCDKGEVVPMEHSTRREEICHEISYENGRTGAIMIDNTNSLTTCQNYNNQENRDVLCKEDKMCTMIQGICTAAYSVGKEFWNEEVKANAQQTCGGKEGGSNEEGSIFLLGGDRVMYDGRCGYSDPFVEWMIIRNNYCISLGDCGDYINSVGDYGGQVKSIINYKDGNKGTFDFFGGNEKTNYTTYQPIIEEKNAGFYDKIDYNSHIIKGAINFSDSINGQVAPGEFKGYLLPQYSLYDAVERMECEYGLIPGFSEFKNFPSGMIFYSCNLWQAPLNGEKCELCNGNKLIPCTEYKCKSLGSKCELTDPVGNAYGSDVSGDVQVCYDSSKCSETIVNTKIKTVKLPIGFSSEITESSREIKVWDGATPRQIKEGQDIKIIFGTEEYAKCYQTTTPVVGAELPEGALEIPQLDATNFNLILKMPDATDPNALPDGETFTIYTQCVDACGNPSSQAYKFIFKIKETPDTLSPRIYFETTETYIPFHSNEGKIKVLADEVLAECKYSFSQSTPYEQMTNTFSSCIPYDPNTIDYFCETTVGNLNMPEQKIIYVKCKDPSGNVNTDNEEQAHTFIKSKAKLEISSVTPTEDQTFKKSFGEGANKISFSIGVTGGLNNDGLSKCDWTLDSLESIAFLDNPASTHNLDFDYSTLRPGSHVMKFNCKDDGENSAMNQRQFNIDVDRTAPIVIRVSKEGSNLVITTNEDAVCYYDNATLPSCSFIPAQVEKIDGTYVTSHSFSFNSDKTYYIKCEDPFKNSNNGCAIIVKGTNFK